jgi:hypothetical protein
MEPEVVVDAEQQRKDQALAAFRAKLLQHKARGPLRALWPLRFGGSVVEPYGLALRARHTPCHLTPCGLPAHHLQELDARVRALREEVKKTRKEYDKTEDDLKALQSVGQIIGEVLRHLDSERCTCPLMPCGAVCAARVPDARLVRHTGH